MTFAPPPRGPMAPREFARSVPDVDRMRRLADAAVATHDEVMARTGMVRAGELPATSPDR